MDRWEPIVMTPAITLDSINDLYKNNGWGERHLKNKDIQNALYMIKMIKTITVGIKITMRLTIFTFYNSR